MCRWDRGEEQTRIADESPLAFVSKSIVSDVEEGTREAYRRIDKTFFINRIIIS